MSFDRLLMNGTYERLKVWSHAQGQLRASWEKTSTDPLISFFNRFFNGLLSDTVKVTQISILDRSVLLFHKPGVNYKNKHFIVWIPGGGFHALRPSDFIGVGSFLCSCAPVLIFDYPKSPENPYPDALYWIYDVLISLFVAENGKRFSDILPIESNDNNCWRILIGGDSAGGNLATILSARLIQKQVDRLVICGLVLIYPLLSFEISGWLPEEDQKVRAIVAPHLVGDAAAGGPLRSRFAVPSRLLNLHDKIIRTDILCYLAQAYVASTDKFHLNDAKRFIIESDDEDSDVNEEGVDIGPSDPSLTPLRLPSSLIQAIPGLFIQVGELDPFLDDSLLLFHKAIANDKFKTSKKTERELSFTILERTTRPNFSLSLVEGVSHGYLQMQLLWKGFEPCMQEVVGAINSMFDQTMLPNSISDSKAPQEALKSPLYFAHEKYKEYQLSATGQPLAHGSLSELSLNEIEAHQIKTPEF